MSARPLFQLADILPLLPHRPPFLFVDCVTALEPHRRLEARRLLRTDEPHFAGHFPGRPIMPGVLLAEALAQASGLLLALSDFVYGGQPPDTPPIYYLAAAQLKFSQPAFPGDALILISEADRQLSNVFQFRCQARVDDRLTAIGSLTLAKAPPGS